MPTETTWTARGVEWRYRGDVTLREVEQENSRFANDPRARRTRYQLVDLRAVSQLDVTSKDATLIGAFDRAQSQSSPPIRVAFLVSDDRFDEHLQVYIAMLEGTSWTARIFTDEDAARAWIAEAA
jgi:hypothetical protein